MFFVEMVSIEVVKKAVEFGPFKTDYHRTTVDSKFRNQFFNYLERSILPQVEGKIDWVDGRLWSNYDEEIFVGEQSIAKRRYSFKIRFFSGREKQTASGEVEYFKEEGEFRVSRRFPPAVATLLAKRVRRDIDKETGLIARRVRAGERDISCPFCGQKISITADEKRIFEIKCSKCFSVHIDYFGPL